MKKRNLKKIFLAGFLTVSIIVSAALPIFAQTALTEEIADGEVSFSSVILNVGADETMRNITWYSESKQAGEVRYAKASEVVDGVFPVVYESAPAIVISTTKTGYYSYKATMSDLEENTQYAYCLVVGDTVSDIYNFDVNAFDDEYSFMFVGDPQVSTYGGPSWSDTLQKIQTHFPKTSFIVSAGDQLETPTSEEDYNNFIVDEIAELPVAITLGTAHDNAQPYKEHYNLPNLSSTYGVSETTSNYFYTYNSTLFMHLNIESKDVASHAAFVQRAVKNNPDCIWKVVVLHYSMYCGAGYDDQTQTSFRATLAPLFSELGVDVVLSGHNHFYARSELMSGELVVSDDVIENNTVVDPVGVLYIDGGPSTSAASHSDGTGIGSDYTLKQDFVSRKKVVAFDMTEDSLTMNAYYVDGEEPEVFDSFTICHSKDKVRLNSDTDMLEVLDGEERVSLVNAYTYTSATVKVVDGSWAVSEDGGTTYTSLGIASSDTDTVLKLNEETGNWELSEDSGASFKSLGVNINKYTVTYVTDTEVSDAINLSDYPTHNVAASELPDDVVLILPQGSMEEGVLHDWAWKYCNADGEEVTAFSAGEEYVAYLERTDLSVSDALYIASATNGAEGIYTWGDAWNIVKRFPGTEFTLTLTEDVTVSAAEVSKLALQVNVTIDLAGYSLDSAAVSNLIILDQGTDMSSVKFITSQSGGALLAQSVFFLSSGAGTTLNLTVGGEGSMPVTVNGAYLANADNNFKTRATLNLDINEGTYNLSNGILRVDNYRPEEARRNTYYINAENAHITVATNPVYFRGSGYSAHANSEFIAKDSTFAYGGSAESTPFFSGSDWYGTAEFSNCSFDGISFDASCAENTAGIIFGEGCAFKSSDATFNSDKSAFASEKLSVADGMELVAYGETMTVYNPDSPIPPEADSTVIDVAAQTDTEAGVLSWSEAWALVNTNTSLKYHLRLSEDITLAPTDAVSLPAATTVNTILDLAGHSLDSTAMARMISFGNSSTKINSSVRIISSVSGGALTSNAVFYLTPGTGDTFTLTFGGEGSRTLSVKGTYLADSTNNFKNGSKLNLNINEGTYELGSLFDVDNYRDTSEKNNYYININDAKISTSSSPVVFKDTGYCAGSASTIKSNDSSFTYSGTASGVPFFAKDQWWGSAEFTACSFGGVNFASSYVQNTAGIVFGEGCIFTDSDSTFSSDKSAFSSDKLTLAADCKLYVSPNADTVEIKSADKVTLEVLVINGDSVIINGSDKGVSTVEDVVRGSVLEMSASGDGEFLYWVDSDSNTILSYDESYTITAGTNRALAAVYADDSDVFVIFTSMGNKLLSLGTVSSITVPADPYVYGYKFAGWYNGGEKTELEAGGAVVADVNTEFKAGFTKDSTEYTVTVDGEESKYMYNEKVSVTAEADKDGDAFSHWEKDGKIVSYDLTYSFYVSADATVNAVYGAGETSDIILVMANPVIVDTNKIAFFAERNISEDYSVIETGILMGKSANLTVDNAMYKAVAKNDANKGQFTVRKANVLSGETYYGVAYLIYSDSEGNVHTAYSNEVSKTL